MIRCSSIVRSTSAGSKRGRTWSEPPLSTVGTKNAAPACESGVHMRKRGASGHSHSPSGSASSSPSCGRCRSRPWACRWCRRCRRSTRCGPGAARRPRAAAGAKPAAASARSVPTPASSSGTGPIVSTCLSPGHLVEQPERALHEHRHRVDDQRRDLGVLQHVGVVVQRAERVQRRAPVALGLAGAQDEQHLGPVEREQRRGRARPAPRDSNAWTYWLIRSAVSRPVRVVSPRNITGLSACRLSAATMRWPLCVPVRRFSLPIGHRLERVLFSGNGREQRARPEVGRRGGVLLRDRGPVRSGA